VKSDASFRTASQRKRKQDKDRSTEEEGAFEDPDPDQWEVRMPNATEDWRKETASKGDIVDLIQLAIHNVVAPGVMALVGTVEDKVKKMESDIHSLRIRTSWMEQDVLKVQADTARAQLIIRNWPTDSTEKDRAATVDALCKTAGLDPSWVKQVHPQYEVNLSPISIITFWSFQDRKWAQEKVGKWCKFHKVLTDGTTESTSISLKMTPAITQGDRRLSAPLQGLMNAYTATYPAYKKVSYIPQWKTLTLVDDKGGWMGRVLYKRTATSTSSTAPSMADWECDVQIPEECHDAVLAQWAKSWGEQRKKQAEVTDAEEEAAVTGSDKCKHFAQLLRKARPEWNFGADLGVPEWKARFKWEFPWPIKFTAVPKGDERRAQFHDLRTIDELMQEMSTDAHMEFDVADWIVNGTKTVTEMQPSNLTDEEKKDLKTSGFEWWPEATGSTTGHWWCRQPDDATGKGWFCWGSNLHRELVEKVREKGKKKVTGATGSTGTTGTEPTGGGAATSSAGTNPPAQTGGGTVSS
jgi:hypothetical protein